jgi:RNA polymerase sigma-70 factor, ECF subfamily
MRDTSLPHAGPSTTDRDAGDRQLLQRIRAGEESALDSLLDKYWTPLAAYAARVLGSWDAAEDAVQETFVRVWKRRAEWELQGSVRTLLFRITRNLALDEKKRHERRDSWSRPENHEPHRVDTPLELLERTELEDAFDRAVAALPERRREIFLHARLDGLSNGEIAEVMGIASQTVANQLSSAVAALRAALLPYPAKSSESSTPPAARVFRS